MEFLSPKTRRVMLILAWVAVFALALSLRSAGLFRGLRAGVVFHPDASKQVLALDNFLNDRYIWYTGSVFYDGYPLFLNHVDEWVVRGARRVRAAVLTHLDPGTPVRKLNQGDLFYWGRGLRVLYGMLVLVAAILVARRLRLPPWSRFLMALFLAAMPLLSTVTHAVTGDIGVDLFSAFCILVVAYMAAQPRSWLLPLLAGTLVGFAFASKYHGLMAGWVPGLYILLSALVLRRRWTLFLRQAVTALAGLAVGVVAAIPQFVSHPERTWADMVLNFNFIKSFNVPAAYYELPWAARLWSNISNGVPLLLVSFGVALCALATLGLVVATLEMWRTVRTRDDQRPESLFFFAVFSFPLLASTLSVLGKPSIEPFHFSYAGLPLVMAATYGLAWLWNRPRRPLKALALLGAATIALDFGVRSYGENFFWFRDENWVAADHLSAALVRPNAAPRATVKSVLLEGPEPTLAVFRNCMVTRLDIPDGAFWNEVGQLPVPGIPVPEHDYWIFANGPIFPRNDRMFHVPDDRRARKCAVYETVPETLWIGLRSGAWPAQAKLRCGAFRDTVTLPANTQRIVPVAATYYERRLPNVLLRQPRLFVPLEVESAVGNVWVTLLSTPRERAQYQYFGGETPETPPVFPALDPSTAAASYAQARYLETTDVEGYVLATDREATPFNYVPLAAGAFTFQVDARPLTSEALLECSVYDPVSGYRLQPPETASLTGGVQTVTFRFTKPFAPYQVSVGLTSRRGNLRLGPCNLRPDLDALLAERPAGDAPPPAWARPLPSDLPPARSGFVEDVAFGNRLQLVDVHVPPAIQPGNLHWDAFRCAMRLTRYPFRHFTEYDVFLDLQGPDGVLPNAMQFPLYQATHSEQVLFPVSCLTPAALTPGEYRVYLGIRNRRTGKALRVRRNSKDVTLMIGTTHYVKEKTHAEE